MNDKDFLNWICDRFVMVYGESENVDFMIRLRWIAGKAVSDEVNGKLDLILSKLENLPVKTCPLCGHPVNSQACAFRHGSGGQSNHLG